MFLKYGFSPQLFTRLLVKFWVSQGLPQDLCVCIILFRLSTPNINSLHFAQAATHQWGLKHHWFCIHRTHIFWCLLELVQETECAPGTWILFICWLYIQNWLFNKQWIGYRHCFLLLAVSLWYTCLNNNNPVCRLYEVPKVIPVAPYAKAVCPKGDPIS